MELLLGIMSWMGILDGKFFLEVFEKSEAVGSLVIGEGYYGSNYRFWVNGNGGKKNMKRCQRDVDVSCNME